MKHLLKVAAVAAAIALLASAPADAKRAPAATREASNVQIVAHPEANQDASLGTWAWTPDVGYPVIAAWAPSVAAGKIGNLTVGDVVSVTGDLAGTYVIVPGNDYTHDVYFQRVAANGHVDTWDADRVGTR